MMSIETTGSSAALKPRKRRLKNMSARISEPVFPRRYLINLLHKIVPQHCGITFGQISPSFVINYYNWQDLPPLYDDVLY